MPLSVTRYPRARRVVVRALDALSLRDTARFARSWLRTFTDGEAGSEREAVRTITTPSRLPPARLVYLVTGRVSRLNYHESGRNARTHLDKVLAEVGKTPTADDRVLDFGCGCGRILRWWYDSPASLHGCDYNPKLVEWCAENLPFATMTVNGLKPPTPYEDSLFDVIYAQSVLTHLTPEVQEAWMVEWSRILRPGGVLIATTLGPTTCSEPGEAARLLAEGIIVKSGELNGENLCTVFNSASDVEARLASVAEVDIALSLPHDMPDSGQDIWVFKKR